ncbi:MAG: hypothetical protein WCD86_22335 [Ktedonobacteraceae bacterium]
MGNSAGTWREYIGSSGERSELSCKQSTTRSASASALLLESLLPVSALVEGRFYSALEQQQNASLLQQFPQMQPSLEYGNGLSIYIPYAYGDEKYIGIIEEKLQAIKYQMRNANLNLGWQFGEIAQDTRWQKPRYDFLQSVDLILLLVTSTFVATEYCYSEELKLAILKHKEESSYVIPILLRACLWDGTFFAGLETITPKNRKAVDEWQKPNLAYN